MTIVQQPGECISLNMETHKKTNSSAAVHVFNVPELLELILLALPWDRSYEEIHSSRLIYLSQTTSSTWHQLLRTSPLIRKHLYLPGPASEVDAVQWLRKTAVPPAQPNPWIPYLLLQRRSWGTSYPFDNSYSAYNLNPSEPKRWTFALEISRAHLERFPTAGSWRTMLAASPPFSYMYFTRAFYELGSGRAPFVTYVDYQPGVPKWKQKHVKHNARGITLGDIADAVLQLFAAEDSDHIRWVRLESVWRPPAGREQSEEYKDATHGMPKTHDLLPLRSVLHWNQQ